jgi:class 3 adenylate cyclase/tetratricopeptide (TPR) repeat protein
MTCPVCRADRREGAKFCQQCGARFAATCSSCGAEIDPASRFCANCGTALRGAPAPAPAPPPSFAAPGLYTPQHLAQRILTEKGALEGERKQVTVLFADLKGSLELLAQRDPEEARTILDPVLQLMMDAVHRYEGTVNQVLGDGIMALFGAPLAVEDHAVRACYTALRMQETIGRHAEKLMQTQRVPIQIRIGLNSGEVVVRSIGSDLNMDYTAVGQTTHLAARMEQMAPPGTTLLTTGTLALAEGFVHVKSLGPLPIKGLSAPLEIFELTGATTARSRLQAATTRGLSRFIGRDSELQAIERAQERARDGHGQVIAVVGEAGVGKSRLFWEFLRSHPEEDWLVLASSSVSYGKATPYMPVIDLLKNYFAIQDRESLQETTEKIAKRLRELSPELLSHLSAFLALLDLPIEDRQWQVLDPPQRRQRTMLAIRQLFVAESEVQPLVLLFEDLHWIDSETQALLDSLRGTVATTRILLLINYRPEYQLGWVSRTGFTEIRIEPLETDSATEFLETLLGPDPSVAPVKSMLIARTVGNPFFLEESVRSLAETGILSGGLGRYRLKRALGTIQVPATVQAVLAARIDRLRPEEKRLLQCASAIGNRAPLPLLEAVVDSPEHVLRKNLVDLQSWEFLFESSLYPDIEYTFKHALTYEVAYGTLLQEQRRALHLKIMEALEQLTADRLDEQVEELARHAFRAEVWSKAVTYFRRAGERATNRPAPREAVAYFEQALAALARLPESRHTIESGIDLRFDLRNALFALGELDRIEQYLGEAGKLAESIGDDRRLGWVSAYRSHYFWRVGDEERMLDCARHAVTLAEASGDFPLQTTTVLLGLAYYGAGDFRKANACLRKIVAALDGDRVHDRFGWAAYPAVTGRAYLATSLAEVGEFSEAQRHAEDALRIAESLDHAFSLGQAHIGLGLVHLRRTDSRAALGVFEAGLALCESRAVSALLPSMAAGLGYAHALIGQHEPGLDLLQRAVHQSAARRFGARHSQWTAWLGEASLLAGHREEARRVATELLETTRRRGERGNEAWTLRLLALLHARAEPPESETAAAHYLSAIALARELDMAPLVAGCEAALGGLYRRTGELERARALLQSAVEKLGLMGMTGWLSAAQADLEALPSPPLKPSA